MTSNAADRSAAPTRAHWLRRALDTVYTSAGVVAAGFMLAVLGLIIVQMVARWSSLTFRGAPDYAGYCMAGASFFAFAYALNRGAHIRVSIVLNALGSKAYWLDVFCFLMGSVVSSYLAWYAVKAVLWSKRFNDISQGQDATPLWIPQLSMAIGSVLLAICFWDNLIQLLIKRRSNVVNESVGH